MTLFMLTATEDSGTVHIHTFKTKKELEVYNSCYIAQGIHTEVEERKEIVPKPVPVISMFIKVGEALLQLQHPVSCIDDVQSYADYFHSKTGEMEYFYVCDSECTSVLSKPYVPHLDSYIVHSDMIYEIDEWNREMEGKYDDIISCKVDINHPYYPTQDSDQFHSDMRRMWAVGITPVYVVR